jgi:hypothetical protein
MAIQKLKTTTRLKPYSLNTPQIKTQKKKKQPSTEDIFSRP